MEETTSRLISWIVGIMRCGGGVMLFLQGVVFLLYSMGVIKQ